jgi:23S rRNA pseudouridine1911/1915/1917 synthase
MNVQTMNPEPKRITLDCRVDSYRSGWTVVEFLSHRFKYHPPERWTHRVEDGRVRVNGECVAKGHRVRKDDVVSYTIIHAEPPVDWRYDVVYEDDDLLAISKSGNIPVHACGVYIKNTLITHLRSLYGQISLAHRLDRETSGLLLLTKNIRAARALSGMFEKGQVSKSYIAVVHGRVEAGSFEVDAPIGKVEYKRVDRPVDGIATVAAAGGQGNYFPRRIIDFENGKPARTRFEVLRRGDGYTVLNVQPTTGRTNQIRVHLHHVGHPLLGDKTYRSVTESSRVPPMARQALHSRSLGFEHPVTRLPMTLTAEVPGDMKHVVDGAGGTF